jgi:peptide/nickel transport system substrate-binding protein
MKKPAVTTSWGQRPADQVFNEAYRSTASWNESYWKNSDFDQKLDQARQELDREKRTVLYHDLQKMLFEQGGTLIPFHVNQVVVTSARVTGLPALFDDGVQYHTVSVGE